MTTTKVRVKRKANATAFRVECDGCGYIGQRNHSGLATDLAELHSQVAHSGSAQVLVVSR